MNKYSKQLIIILFVGLIFFYGVPLVLKLIPATFGMGFFIMLLLILNPIYSFVSSLVYTRNNGIKWYISVLIGILFTPTVFIFYNESAVVYIMVYIAISIIGSIVGILLRDKARFV